MHFIKRLPLAQQKTSHCSRSRSTKYAHFLALPHPYTTFTVVETSFAHVQKLPSSQASMVSNRGSISLSIFWKHLLKLVSTSLLHSSAYRPQTNGQTERLNQCLEAYLRYMTNDQPKPWPTWLPLAEWCYNTNYLSSIKMTHFKALYNYKPPLFTITRLFLCRLGKLAIRQRPPSARQPPQEQSCQGTSPNEVLH